MKIDDTKELQLHRRTLPMEFAGLHLREGEDSDGRTIEGYAVMFETPSVDLWHDGDTIGREIIESGAITEEMLKSSDVKFTMFHNREILLARSNKGKGSLTYSVDDKGVFFSFSAPNTIYGDYAVEAVRRGDIAGCSFAFFTYYWDEAFVGREVEKTVDDKTIVTYRVKKIIGVDDMTLAVTPAYDQTSVQAREVGTGELKERHVGTQPDTSQHPEAVSEETHKLLRKIRTQTNPL